MLLLQDKTWLPLMSRLSTLGCQTTGYCSGLPLLLTRSRLSSHSSIALAFTGHQLLPVSSVVCSLSAEWFALPRPRHDDVTSWHQTERHLRTCHPSTYSHPPPTRSFLHSSIVAFGQFSMLQPGWWVILSRARYTFTPRPPLVAVTNNVLHDKPIAKRP